MHPTTATSSSKAVDNRQAFACLWIGRDLSALGDWILLVALLAWIYRSRESAALISILLLTRMLPAFLLAPAVRSVLRLRQSRIVGVAAQLLRAAVLLPLLDVKFSDQMLDVYLVALLATLALVFHRASQDALLPTLIAPSLRSTADKALAATTATTLVVGGAAGTYLFESGGLSTCVMAAIAASAVSGLLLALARPSTPARSDLASPGEDSLGRGLVASISLPSLRPAALVRVATGLLAGGLLAAQVAFVTLGLFLSSERIGYVLAGQGFGVLLAVAALSWARARFYPSTLVATALVIAGMGEFGYAISGSLEAAAGFVGLAGFGLTILAGSLTSMTESAAPDSLRGSVAGALDWASGGAALLSAIAVGPLADAVTPRFTLAAASILLCVLALYAFGAVSDSSPSTEPRRSGSPSTTSSAHPA